MGYDDLFPHPDIEVVPLSPYFLFIFCLGAFICLLPLTIYCLVLAYINNRRHPTLTSGVWDFVYLMLGLSGFIIIGGPLLLTAFDSLWRMAWLRGDFAEMRGILDATSGYWLPLWGTYFVLLIAVLALVLYLRRNISLIYHVNPDGLFSILEEAVHHVGRECRVERRGLLILGQPSTEPTSEQSPPERLSSSKPGWLEVRLFRATGHATLHWYDVPAKLREELELEIDHLLQKTESPPNPTSGWLLTVASFLFFLLLFSLLLVVTLLWDEPAS